MLYGNIEDYSDTESQASARAFNPDDTDGNSFSNPNLVYGERVRVRESSVLTQQQQRANSKMQAAAHHHKSSVLSGGSQPRNVSETNKSQSHDRVESTNSMSTLHRLSSADIQQGRASSGVPSQPVVQRNSSYLGGNNDDDTVETGSNQSRTNTNNNSRSKSPNTLMFVKANVRKK
jgi:hypothetical protein